MLPDFDFDLETQDGAQEGGDARAANIFFHIKVAGASYTDLGGGGAVVGTTGLLEGLLDLNLGDVGEVLTVELDGEILDD